VGRPRERPHDRRHADIDFRHAARRLHGVIRELVDRDRVERRLLRRPAEQRHVPGDSQYGIREFVVATGGATLVPTNNNAARSETWEASTLGVLKLTLHSTSYDWQFVPVAGGTYTDSGTGSCHSGHPNIPVQPPPGPPPFSGPFQPGR
jgi:hypothetical protein